MDYKEIANKDEKKQEIDLNKEKEVNKFIQEISAALIRNFDAEEQRHILFEIKRTILSNYEGKLKHYLDMATDFKNRIDLLSK